MDLSIIIVNYKSRGQLLNCLNSIGRSQPSGLNYEIIVVDNNSGDDLSELTYSQLPLKVVISPKNLGMGGGNNLGIQQAAGDYILVLNPDTVITGEAISILWHDLAANPNVGLVGPKLLYPDGALQFSCLHFPGFFIPVLRRTFLGDYFKSSRDYFTMTSFDHRSRQEVDWLMGSCLMFKKEIKQRTGLILTPRFDERYFMYFEDTDLARQFKAAGLAVIYNPAAVVVHDHRRASARYPWYQAVFLDRLVWYHISSWFKYFLKWGLAKPSGLAVNK